MAKYKSNTFHLFLITAFCCGLVTAQTKSDKPEIVAPQVVVRSVATGGGGNGSGYYREDEDDSKVTGATVRGRVIYEDTSRPVRYVLVTLTAENAAIYSSYSAKFAKTDENGEFVIKNVKAGTYIPYIKSDGILNLDSYKFSYQRRGQSEAQKAEESQFDKIVIGGLGEFQVVVRARRGGSISGRILFADGEAAVGVKVEALRKEDGRFSNASTVYGNQTSVGKVNTDDRGFYRLAGLPEGQYLVRVVEPVSQSQTSAQYLYDSQRNQDSILKTYYPTGESSVDAKEIEVLPGQDQTAIDITLPERQLYGVSGKILKKQTSEPLSNFTINYFKIPERPELVAESYGGNSVNSNKAGEWSLKSLPKGKYRITVSQGYVNQQNKETDKPQPGYPNMSKEIEITDKNLADVNFEMPNESGISGTIIVEGGKEVPLETRIYAANEETKELNYPEIDYRQYQNKNQQSVKEKVFRIGKLKEGKYRVILFGQNFYLKSATLGGRDVTNSPIEIKEGEELKGLQVVLSTEMGTVKGKIANYDGKEQAAVVMIKPGADQDQSRYGSFSAQIKPTGDFEIKAAPGEYSIFVYSFKNAPKSKEEIEQWFRNLTKNAQPVSVKSNETTTISLSMPN